MNSAGPTPWLYNTTSILSPFVMFVWQSICGLTEIWLCLLVNMPCQIEVPKADKAITAAQKDIISPVENNCDRCSEFNSNLVSFLYHV